MAGNNDQTIRIRFDVDTSGLRRGLDDARRGANDAGNGLRRLGDNSGIKNATSAVKGLTSSLGSAVKGAAGLVVGLAAIGGAKSILDGVINRVDAIHGGKKTMTILFDGDTKRAEKAMDIVKKSVEGTPLTLNFGVGQMTKLIASGMDEATAGKTLQLSMDVAATFDPGNIEGMTSELNDIFSKISAKGAMDMTHLDSLNTRGIPTLKLLAQHYGVSEEAARQMVKDGKVGIEDLNEALSGYEGTAKTAGDSISGMFSNIKTAIINAFSTPFMDDDKYQSVVDGLGGVLDYVKGPFSKGISDGMVKAFDFIQEAMPTIQAGLTAAGDLFNAFKDNALEVWDAIATEFGGGELSGLDQVKSVFEWVSENADGIAKAVMGVVAAFIAWKTAMVVINTVLAIYEGIALIASVATTVFNAALWANPITWIVAAVLALIAVIVLMVVYWDEISAFMIGIWENIKESAVDIWEGLKEFFSELWTTIKEWAIQEWEAFQEMMVAIWEGIVEIASEVWEGLKTFFSDLWTAIKEWAIQEWEDFTTLISDIWQSIVEGASAIWEGLKEFFVNLWNSIKETANSLWEGLKSSLVSMWEGIISSASSIWEGLKTYFSGLWDNVKSLFSDTWDSIKTTLTNTWDNIKSTASEKWDAVKEAMFKPVDEAKELISDAIDAIKGFFSNLKLKFPKIEMPPLPHFSISGSFSLKPPSVPKIGVSWYATGGIATGPSIVGIGEAGDEAILPLSNKAKMKPFANAVASLMGSSSGNNDGGGNIINEFHINATIREEADIIKLSKEIVRQQQRRDRAGGSK